MIQRLLVLLFLPLFLTACGSSSSDSTASPSGSSTLTDIATTGAPNIDYDGYDSFDAAVEGTKTANTAQTLVLGGTAVQEYYNLSLTRPSTSIEWADEHITSDSTVISNITAPAFSLTYDTYDDNGSIDSYISSATLYVGNKTYTATIPANEEYKSSSSFSGDSNDVYINGHSYFYNNNDGFSAQYMMRINWYELTNPLSDSATTGTFSGYDGYMIAGFETAGNQIPNEIDNANFAVFKGVGGGEYSDYPAKNTVHYSYQTLGFDITANVDFGARTVALQTQNTGGCITITEGGDCVAVSLSQLNFTSTLTYDAGKNNISGTVATAGMSGTANAKFYGTGDDVAHELGGTFGMKSDTNEYYYGWFGAQCTQSCDYSAPVIPTPTTTISIGNDIATTGTPALETLGYDSLTAASDGANTDNATKTLILEGLGVQLYGKVTYNRDEPTTVWNDDHIASYDNIISNINTPRLSFTFDADGNISEASFYVGDKIYTAINDGEMIDEEDDETSDNLEFISKINDNDNYAVLSLGRELKSDTDSSFSFISQYMIASIWGVIGDTLSYDDTTLTADSHNYYIGYSFAGLETAGGNIPTNIGNTVFKGGGNGNYATPTNDYSVEFDLTADVDFSERTVDLMAINSGEYCDDDAENCTETLLSQLNFTTTLTYDAGQNNISGDVTNVDGMSGTADARFYGTGTNAAKELGGTFALASTDSYYYGLFGVTCGQSCNDSSSPNTGGGDNTGGGTVTLNALDTLPSKNSQRVDYIEYARFDDFRNQTVRLGGMAVTLIDISKYTRPEDVSWLSAFRKDELQIDSQITPTRITSPVVALTFDDYGNISGITSQYIKEYTATANTPLSGTSFTGTYDDDDVSIDVKVDRSTIFGFDSESMAYIEWNASENLDVRDSMFEQTLHDIDGMMIVGVGEDSFFENEGTAEFIGKGVGVYGTKTAKDDVTFDVKAYIYFETGMLTIRTENTACVTACNTGVTASTLNIDTGSNNFTVTLDSTLTGTLDARFYGGDARELGGTFALAEADTRYYYGAFGAQRGDIKFLTPITRWTETADSQTTADGISFTESSATVANEIFGIEQSADGAITNIAINDKVFDTGGVFGGNLHISDKITIGGQGELRFVNQSTKSNWVAFNDNRVSGFDYHIVGSWKDGSTSGGFTAGSLTHYIPTSGSSTFNGKVYGLYTASDTEYVTRGTATITANFSNGSASVNVTGTEKLEAPVFGNSVSYTGFESASPASNLNFSGTLTYDSENEWFKGNVSASSLSGEAAVKIYGPNAEEAGGAFEMGSGDTTYVGGFGGKK